MNSYYENKLSAERLKRCYEIAPPRVRQYLDAEVNHVAMKIRNGDRVLELGCGYGRVLDHLRRKGGDIFGIDTSLASLRQAQQELRSAEGCHVLNMDAVCLGFRDQVFDMVVCIQNGISAFHVDQKALVAESLRVTKPGGTALFSSYSEKFWDHRLQWFELQSGAGLLGEIDYSRTGDGVIVCKDGFTATTLGQHEFASLTSGFDVVTHIVEVDRSSLFCEVTVR